MKKAGAVQKPLSIDGQRVYFGSSENMASLRAESVDFIITSPPYWNLKKYGEHPGQVGNEEYDQYIQRLNVVWNECYRVAKENAVMVINVNSRRNKGRFYPIAFDIYKEMEGWKLWDVLIWYIPNALPQPNHYMHRLFDNKFEYLMVFLKGDSSSYKFHKPRVPQKYLVADPRDHKKNKNGRCVGNIFRIPAYRPPNVKKLGYHEAAFPEELVALMLETFTDPGDTVLDPFTGSGTTLKVARTMERMGVGFEINEKYRELIAQNIRVPWQVPDWRKIDIIHSTTAATGSFEPRKIHFYRMSEAQSLFGD